MSKVLNFGSLNIDYVYRVPHFVKPGETLSSRSLEIFAGGKGANQSVALAKAGADVFHAGKIGSDGLFLKSKLESYSVKSRFILSSKGKNGHAMIQVDDQGQNAIVLYPGTNKEIEKSEIDKVLSHFSKGDYLLLQNEINHVDYLIERGHQLGLKICLNPAPMGKGVLDYPLEHVDLLIVNETEGEALSGESDFDKILQTLSHKYPLTEIVLTAGGSGAYFQLGNEKIHVEAPKVKIVDTTAAGDTFIGFFLKEKIENKPVEICLEKASQAAGLCIAKMGAMDAIPGEKDLK